MTLTLLNLKRGNRLNAVKPADRQTGIDYFGAVLLVLATVALMAIIDHKIMEILGFELRIAIVLLFASSFLGFLYHEWTAASPILDLALFRIRMFTLSGLSLLLVGIAQVMVGFVLPFYLQDILDLSPSFMGLLFISAPVFTVTLSPLAGWVADKVGPRLPSTAGILFLVIAAFIGGFLHADSHWTSAVIVLALWGLATAMFYPPNHAAMIGSVPAQHRGVATGAIYVLFGLGSTFGISMGTLLLTAAFRYYSGDALATPTPANPAVFVSAMNFTFFVAGIMGLVAMACSAMRGTEKRRPPMD
jgi:MFS family permease